MKKIFVLIVCLITNLAFADGGSAIQEMGNLWIAVGEKSEKIELHRQKIAAVLKNNQSAQEQLDLYDEAIELAMFELQDDQILRARFLSYLCTCKAACHGSLKDYDRAHGACMMAIGFDSNNGFAYFAKGLIWYATGCPREGAACMKIASSKGCALADEFALSYDL